MNICLLSAEPLALLQGPSMCYLLFTLPKLACVASLMETLDLNDFIKVRSSVMMGLRHWMQSPLFVTLLHSPFQEHLCPGGGCLEAGCETK